MNRLGNVPRWLSLALCLLIGQVAAARVDAVAERWAGSIALPTGGTLDFSVRFSKTDGAPTALLSIPIQGMTDIACRDVAIDGAARRFTLGDPNPRPAWAVFEVTVDDAGRAATGTMKQAGMNLRVAMDRLKEGEADRTGASFDDRKLPGDRWTGVIEIAADQKLEFSVRLVAGKDGAPATGTMSIPVQGLRDGELHDVAIEPDARRFTLRVGANEVNWARFTLRPGEDGTTATGFMRQSGGNFKVTARRLGADEKAPEARRPQHPSPPFPYETQDVRYKNPVSDGTLAGTLTLPPGDGPFPAALLITGSGPEDRDETLFGHKPFLVIADHLTRQGIAVLRVDDRGVGGSTAGTPTDTSEDFATDVRAGIAFLAAQPKVDPARIGLIGHSEGGVIAAIVAGAPAARGGAGAGVAWIVMLAGPGVTGREIAIDQAASLVGVSEVGEVAAAIKAAATKAIDAVIAGKGSSEVKEAVRELVVAQYRAAGVSQPAELDATVDAAAATFGTPWFRYFLSYNPANDLSRVKVPVLALNGELDMQVRAAANLAAIERTLKAAGNGDVTVKSMPGLNHLFQRATTGGMAEYGTLEETFNADALAIIAKWIRDRTGLSR